MGMVLRMLGPLEVERGGESFSPDRPAQRRLLSVLALAGGGRISTDVLIDRFWGGEPPETARAAIQTHVSGLRRSLGDGVVVTEGYGYRLNLDDHQLDATEFTTLASKATDLVGSRDWEPALESVEKALGLCRGDPYSELTDDEFARAEITRLTELHIELLEAKAECLIALGREQETLPDLEALVIEHPYRERLWEHLMTARYRLGRHTEALQAFREVTEHLAEIGVEPGQPLQRLEEKILLHDRSLTRTKHNLPVELDTFIAREAEAAEITKLLADNRLVTLTGPGGSGKTRLATHTTRQLLHHYPDGIWLIEFADLDHSGLVASQIGLVLGLKPRGDDVLTLLAETIAAEQMLLIFDNCEHLLQSCAAASQTLLEVSPRLRIMATSREPLHVPGEAVVELGGMAFPDGDVKDSREALDYSSVRLFAHRASLIRQDFALDASNIDAVIAICRRLEGMPLAIELAAARVRSLTPHVIADRLEDRLKLLGGRSTTAPARQRTLEATIEWSYQLLGNNETNVLRRLSVFRGGFSLEAAERVVAGRGIPGPEVVPIVSDLVDKSLISTIDGHVGDRFRFLETVRQYAAEKLEDSGEAPWAKDQHLRWCLSVIDDLWERAVARGQVELTESLELESENLRGAFEWSETQHNGPSVVELAQSLGWRWYLKGHFVPALQILSDGLSAAKTDRDVCLIHALRAYCHAYSEEIDGALTEAARAHRLVDAVSSPILRVWVLSAVHLSYFMSVETDPRQMLSLAADAGEIALESGDVFANVMAHQQLADAYCWNGRTEEGLRVQRVALDLASGTGDAATINRVFGSSIYNYMLDAGARRTEPFAVIEEWLSLVDLGPDAWTSVATDWLPWVYMQVGAFDRAREAIEKIGDRTMEGYNRTTFLIARANLAFMEGNLEAAIRDIDDVAHTGVNPRWGHTFYPLAAEVYADLGRIEDVRRIAATYLTARVHASREAAKLGVLNPLTRAEVTSFLENGDREHLRRAQSALARMQHIPEKYPPLAGGWLSVLTHGQNLTLAEAEMTRATGPSPEKWSKAVEQADYAYYRVYAAWRLAEARLQNGDVTAGSSELRNSSRGAAKAGTTLLSRRIEETAAKFGIDLS